MRSAVCGHYGRRRSPKATARPYSDRHDNDAKLGKMSAHRIDQHRALALPLRGSNPRKGAANLYSEFRKGTLRASQLAKIRTFEQLQMDML